MVVWTTWKNLLLIRMENEEFSVESSEEVEERTKEENSNKTHFHESNRSTTSTLSPLSPEKEKEILETEIYEDENQDEFVAEDSKEKKDEINDDRIKLNTSFHSPNQTLKREIFGLIEEIDQENQKKEDTIEMENQEKEETQESEEEEEMKPIQLLKKKNLYDTPNTPNFYREREKRKTEQKVHKKLLEKQTEEFEDKLELLKIEMQKKMGVLEKKVREKENGKMETKIKLLELEKEELLEKVKQLEVQKETKVKELELERKRFKETIELKEERMEEKILVKVGEMREKQRLIKEKLSDTTEQIGLMGKEKKERETKMKKMEKELEELREMKTKLIVDNKKNANEYQKIIMKSKLFNEELRVEATIEESKRIVELIESRIIEKQKELEQKRKKREGFVEIIEEKDFVLSTEEEEMEFKKMKELRVENTTLKKKLEKIKTINDNLKKENSMLKKEEQRLAHRGTGWLYVEGKQGFSKKFQLYYVCFDKENDKIQLFFQPNYVNSKSKPKKTIKLVANYICKPIVHKKMKNCFQVLVSDEKGKTGNFKFGAESEIEANRWINFINEKKNPTKTSDETDEESKFEVTIE